MDQRLPNAVEESSDPAPHRGRRRRGRRVVVAGGARLAIVALDRDGFAVEATAGPRLRGFVDIMEGDKRLDRRLVVCAWERDGLIGYEYKRAAARRLPALDYPLPDDS